MLVCAAVGLGTTSCSDYLEEDNKTGETADLSYQTATGIDGLMNSAYAYTRGWWGKEPSLGLSECGTDLWYAGHDNKQNSLVKYNMTAEALGNNDVNNNPCFDQYWEMFYAGIDVCNNALVYVPKCTAISEEKKNAYLGEAYFLRSLYYSQLVATWGPIPYNSEAIVATNTTPTRMPEAEVYKNILNDLEKSMEYLKNVKTLAQSTSATAGHATYYSAEALYARVALYAASWLGSNAVEGYSDLYKTALAAADDVISNSGAAFYDRFSDTWNMNNEEPGKNTESLFSVHYGNTVTSGYDNCVPYRFAVDSEGNHLQYNSLITRKGYSANGGSVSFLMFVPTWDNGCSDLGGRGSKITNVFLRITNATTRTITSKKTGSDIDVAKYYSPYSCGYTRYLPSLYLWKTLDQVKNTDQRYNATLLTSYRIPEELSENAIKNYPNMSDQTFKDYDEAYKEDGNYFNGGGAAIVYSMLDGDSEEGKALQAEAKNKYRLQFAFGGDIPVYTSGDPATALPTETAKAVSDVYGDARYNNSKIGGWYSFPGVKKFLDDQFDESNYSCGNAISYRDIMVLRLAEMYLIKAEAQLQTGDASAAKTTINELRAKRAISGTDNSLEAAYGETTVDIETILRERALELCGEYQRWFDLKRTHTLIDHVKKYNAQASGSIDVKHYYRPIPSDQMAGVTNRIECPTTANSTTGVLNYTTAADGFWQNPGY